MKLAILQMSDAPHIESVAVLLNYAGYEVKVCSTQLCSYLKQMGCRVVISVDHMEHVGYDPLDSSIGQATIGDLEKCDLYIDVKPSNFYRVWTKHSRLKYRSLYVRVNGGQPEISSVENEVILPCPILTSCFWYATKRYYQDEETRPSCVDYEKEFAALKAVTMQDHLDTHRNLKTGMNGMAYTCYLPYANSKEYLAVDRFSLTSYDSPYCLAYGVKNWGYGPIVDRCRNDLKVRMYGNQDMEGQISHRRVVEIASKAKALVHLKAVDCPGWALYEAILSGCPVIVGRFFNSRTLFYDLLVNNETCFEFGTHSSMDFGRGDMEYDKCYQDIAEALTKLSEPATNYKIGNDGRNRLLELMWNKERDGDSFNQFIERWFA